MFIFFNFIFASLDTNWQDLLAKYQIPSNLSSYCLKSDKVTGTNTTKLMAPASVTKLFLSYYALVKLGIDFKYKTKVILNEDLNLEGSGDPFFVSENVFLLIRELNLRGKFFAKDINISDQFFFNWSDNSNKIKKELIKYFNTASWNTTIKNEFNEFKKRSNATYDLNFSLGTPANEEKQLELTSLDLMGYLKQMNIYSNNFMADKILTTAGNIKDFNDFFKKLLEDESISFETASGLPKNLVSCQTTLKLLEKLDQLLNTYKYQLTDLLATSGTTVGTLDKRFTNYEHTLWAKTGTLKDTITLAGILNTTQGKVYFAIFNFTSRLAQARNLQDEFIAKIFEIYPPKKFTDRNISYFPTSTIQDI